MGRKTMSKVFIAVVLVLGLVGCHLNQRGENAGPPGELIDIGGYGLHLYCEGQGRPVVFIDTGWGDTAEGWQLLQGEVAQETRVCVYERAGYGWSEPGPDPRTSQQIVDELAQLLDRAEVEMPVVLVGHSFGGINVQLFACQHADQIVGLVLLDPSPLPFILGEAFPELQYMAEEITQNLLQLAEAARHSSDAEEAARASYYQTLASEHEMMFSESAKQIQGSKIPEHIPITVVAAGRPNPALGDVAEPFQQFWIEENRALAARSEKGTFVLVEESGHHLYVDAPTRVMEAILDMVRK